MLCVDQPALLYLVPMCLGGSVVTAVMQGDVKGLLAYDEEAANNAAKEEQKRKKMLQNETEETDDGLGRSEGDKKEK